MSTIKLSTGSLPSPQLDRLASSRPFIDRIDLVFPSTVPDHGFLALKTTSSTAQCTLAELYAHASTVAPPFTAVPLQDDADETWCIDPRGVLTLSVPNTLYTQLGLVGRKLPFKPERYTIALALRGEHARTQAGLAVWDAVRARRWDVACTGSAPPGAHTVSVAPRVRRDAGVHVPHVGALALAADEPALHALFEWVGMACLGAQRLRADDRVDPYVAVYEPPPSSVGAVTHMRWQGLMDTPFVQSVIDAAVSALTVGDDNHFVAITLHSNRVAPVSYIPLGKDAPPRVTGPEAEDTVCVLFSKSSDRLTWAMAQSIGKLDTRWG